MSAAARSRLLRWALIAIATFICCWLAASRLDWSELGGTLGEMNLVPLAAGWAALIGFYFLRALRWRVILGAALSVPDSFAMSSVGYLVSSALPLQGGELVKVNLLHTRTGMPYARGLASIIAERMLDVGAIVLLVVSCLAYGLAAGAPEVEDISPGALPNPLSTWAAAIVIVLCVACLCLSLLILRVDQRLSALGGRVRRTVHTSIIETWSVLKAREASRRILALTVGAWSLNLLSVWLTTRAVGLSMTPFEVSLCFGLVTLGLSIPLTPGYVGQYELLWLEVMQLVGISYGPASNHLPLILHAMILIAISVLGIAGVLFLARRKNARPSAMGPSGAASFGNAVDRTGFRA